MDRRKLKSIYYLMVEGIQFAVPTRASGVTWTTTTDNVVLKGTLEQILIFALQNFTVQSVAVLEEFAIIDERSFKNMPATDDVTVLDLDPGSGNDLVVDEEVQIVSKITGQYRDDWVTQSGAVFEAVTGGARSYYKGQLLAILAYLLQYDGDNTDYVYNLFKWALFDHSKAFVAGADFLDILGTQGPTLVEQAHTKLGNMILNA